MLLPVDVNRCLDNYDNQSRVELKNKVCARLFRPCSLNASYAVKSKSILNPYLHRNGVVTYCMKSL
jgi:hypothetical protein